MSRRYLTKPEFNAIIAGLRVLQDHLETRACRSAWYDEILTEGRVESIDADGIDVLVDEINCDEVQLRVEGD